MLKRMVVIGGAETLRRAAAAGADWQVQALAGSEAGKLPPGTSVVLADSGQIEAAVQAAAALGACHEDLLNLLASALDCREDFPSNASLRVMNHAARYAQALGFSIEDQLTLERGALVRDIGKIRIGNDVLLKSGALSYEEWGLIRQHPHLGAEIVRNHHECYDGDGYPDGLEGEAIPYFARIVKVLDVYCAMTSPRHYRSGYSSHDEAVEYLCSERGKHFDPKLVDVFIDAKVGQA